MSEGFTQFFPAKIGDTVYIISRAGFIREYRVSGYIVQGQNPHENRVRLSYTDRNGMPHETFRAMNLFDRTMFTNRRQAEVAAATAKGETV